MIIGQCEPEGRLSLILKVLNGLKNKTVLVGPTQYKIDIGIIITVGRLSQKQR